MRKKTGGKNGFTLIEVLVSMAIFTILFGITIVAFQQTRKIERLRGGTLQLVSDLQKVRNFSSTGMAQSGTVPVGGYGIHLDKNATSYRIFADKELVNSDNPANPCLSCFDFCNLRYDGVGLNDCNDPTVLNINLQSGVIIYDIRDITGGVNNSKSSADITYKPLESFPYIGFLTALENRDPNKSALYEAKTGLTIEIFMKLKDNDICRKVTVKGSISQIAESNTTCP